MNAPIILIGGRSRAARAVRAAMASRTCLGVVRADPAKNEVATPDYAAVPGDLDLAGATIVNCVGSPQGDPAQLMHLNRDVPAAWASAASERGARSMVHISSFSIFGLAETVANGTEPAPVNAYGASKLAAEEALAQIDAQGFPVCRLRVPILVGGGPDKLAQLVRLARRTGFVPRASREVTDLPRGARVRLALQELGPIFVKFGQVLSTRRDLVPPDIADELVQIVVRFLSGKPSGLTNPSRH